MSDAIVLSSAEEDDCFEIDSDSDYGDGGERWTCAQCTSLNSALVSDCGVCGIPKEDDTQLRDDDVVDVAGAAEAYVRTTRLSEEEITLDKCGCVLDRRKLRTHVVEVAGRLSEDLDELQGQFCCCNSRCKAALTRRDIVSMLGAKACQLVDLHIYSVFVKQLNSDVAHKQKKPRVLSSPASRSALNLVAEIVALQTSLGIKPIAPAESKASSSRWSLPTVTTRQAKKASAGEGAKGSAQKNPTAKKQAAKGKGIAKGTGYGGERGHHMHHDPTGYGRSQKSLPKQDAGVKKAREEEVKADQVTLKDLQAIKACIDYSSGGPASRLLQGCCMMTCGVAFGGPLAYLLKRLLQNDSLMDIGRRSELYWGVVRLIQSLGKCVDFIPLFLKPAANPFDKEDDEEAECMLDALKKLDIQCRVFKRNAEDLESEEEIKALSLALEINSSFEELQKAADVLRSVDQDQQPASDPDLPENRAAQGEDQNSLEKRYCEAVSKFRLGQWPLVTLQDFYFRQEAAKGQNMAGRKSMLRIGQELSSLATSVPTAWATSVFLVTDENRMDILRACIIGPEGTPYANGIFLFDILLPPEYPERPPKVQFLTTGGGRVRFNPNLYDCGKVCLSLLGTWAGPSWDPATSTLLQVLVSIQGMIFVDDPYFNEPGYEQSAGTSSGSAQSQAYNRKIRSYTLNYSLLTALTNPPPAFKEVLQVHFKFKQAAIIKQMQEWGLQDPSLNRTAHAIKEALQKSLEGCPQKPIRK